MAGSVTVAGGGVRIMGGSPGGSDKQVQFNDSGNFAGCAQLFWDKVNDRLGVGDSTPAKQLSLTKCMELLTCSGSGVGVIYKGADRFIHDYKAAGADGNNVFVGLDAGNFSMAISGQAYHASYNVGIGRDALKVLTEGYYNIGIGAYALSNAATANSNVGIGQNALQENVNGDKNIAIGRGTGYGINATSISNNVLLGHCAGYALTTGGDNNICIGYRAGDNVTSGEKNIVIGYDLNALSATADSQLNIGSLIFGDLGTTKKVGINTSTMNETLNVGGAIRLGTTALTNAGTIRWTGTDFEGHEGAAWVSLTASDGLWTDESANNYYRPNNVTNSGNTGFRIYDAGYSLLGQVAPTTGSICGAGSTDGTVLRINHGNGGSSTASANPPLWVKRYYNYAGATWNAGAAYFGTVKTAGAGSLHTVQIDTHCSGGTVPAAGGVLSCLLSHLKNDSVVGSAQDIHNMQIITYMPVNAYSSVHAAVMVDLNNRRASEGWLDDYADKWSCGVRVANESTSAYDNSCAYSTGSAAGGGKWYVGLGLTGIAYDASLNKGEGIYCKTSTFDTNAVCMRAEDALTLMGGTNIDFYAGTASWFIWYNGRVNSRNKRMELTNTGNLNVDGVVTENSWSLDEEIVRCKKWALLDSCHEAFESHDGNNLHKVLQVIDKDTGKIGKRPSDIIQILVACIKELKNGL